MKGNELILAAGLLMAAPATVAAAEGNGGAQQTLTVDEKQVERTVSEIRIDGNNAVVMFTDGGRLTADMRLVALTMSYDEATGISRLNMTDREGNRKVYDLQGRPVDGAQAAKGIYIVNGKKVIINNK